MKMKKSAFTDGGQAICVGTVGVYCLWLFFGDYFKEVLVGMIPYCLGLTAFAYVLYNINLEGE